MKNVSIGKVTKIIGNLMEDCRENSAASHDPYAEGYHDALVDVLRQLVINTDAEHYD